MLPPFDIFNPARTHCPSCNATLNTLADSCAFCGFNAQICVQRYPFPPPPLDRFVDPDDCLQPRERKILTKSIKRLEKRFSQISVTVATMALPDNVDGREFGYWFINRAEIQNDEDRHRRLHHILVLVDRNSKTVSITVGYGLDCFLDDQLLFLSLERTAQTFTARGFAAGICAWLNHIGNQLLPIHKEAKFARDRWTRYLRNDLAGGVDTEQQLPTVSQGYQVVEGAHRPVPRRPRSETPPTVTSYDA